MTPTPPTPKDKEEHMPWGSWINDLPTEFFLVVHITAFALASVTFTSSVPIWLVREHGNATNAALRERRDSSP